MNLARALSNAEPRSALYGHDDYTQRKRTMHKLEKLSRLSFLIAVVVFTLWLLYLAAYR